MAHFYLSPHPDDAALSCGAHIATLTRNGDLAAIVTLLAGDPPAEFISLPLSELVAENWTRWGLGSGALATAGRRAEDEAAARVLGAEIYFGAFPDALYRVSEGRALYTELLSLYQPPHPADPLWGAVVRERAPEVVTWLGMKPGDILHIPLGVGNHVDHQLVRHLGQEIAIQANQFDLRYYEEYPYSVQAEDAVMRALTLTGIADHATPIIYPVSGWAIETKIEAVGCYRSQLSSFSSDFDRTSAAIRAYCTQVGGEREWVVPVLSAEHSTGS
jgi:LmbE family N-acetylglucosaminyl deacetylase